MVNTAVIRSSSSGTGKQDTREAAFGTTRKRRPLNSTKEVRLTTRKMFMSAEVFIITLGLSEVGTTRNPATSCGARPQGTVRRGTAQVR